MKKNLIWIIVFLMGSVATMAQSYIDISADTTIVTDVVIGADVDTVIVSGDIYVDTVGSLTIEPGVVFVFTGNYKIDVEGSIVAEGTEDEPVIFTVMDTTGFHDGSNTPWAGIEIVQAYNESDADPSSFSYCEFYFADAAGDSYNTSGGAILVVDYDHLTVSNCVFMHNAAAQGAAIHTKNSIIKITDCFFDSNLGTSEGGTVNISGNHSSGFSSKVYMTGCTLLNSTGDYGGAFRAVCGRNHYIANNVFKYNYGDQGGAVLFGGEPDSTLFINNFVSNNTADVDGGGGVRTSGRSTPILMNNIIVNNTTYGNGGGVKIGSTSSPVLINNTIANNTADQYGGGLFTSCSTDSAKIYNTIIYGNMADSGDQVFMYLINDDTLTTQFYHCNIEGDSAAFAIASSSKSLITNVPGAAPMVYEGNINADPEFANPTSAAGVEEETEAADWMITGTTACMDAGMEVSIPVADFPVADFFGNDRMIGEATDIGAHEYDYPAGIVCQAETGSEIRLYPNPASDILSVEFDAINVNSIQVFNIQGKLILNNTMNQNQALLDVSNLKEGIYLLRVNAVEGIYTQKFIVE